MQLHESIAGARNVQPTTKRWLRLYNDSIEARQSLWPACPCYLSGCKDFVAASSPIFCPMAVPTSVEVR